MQFVLQASGSAGKNQMKLFQRIRWYSNPGDMLTTRSEDFLIRNLAEQKGKNYYIGQVYTTHPRFNTSVHILYPHEVDKVPKKFRNLFEDETARYVRCHSGRILTAHEVENDLEGELCQFVIPGLNETDLPKGTVPRISGHGGASSSRT